MAVAPDPMTRFNDAAMHAAARMYYLDNATQGTVAERLGVSRATVSRMLAEARRRGIVRIEVVAPVDPDVAELARSVESALGLARVELSGLPPGDAPGTALAPAVATLLREVDLRPGDGLLIASGRTLFEVAQGDLPPLPGVRLAPMLGGQDEPEAWYATNEIMRQFAAKLEGSPVFLYAPALPGPGLHAVLREELPIQRVLELWASARCAIVGVGAAPLTRTSIPAFVPVEAASLRDAVGDVMSRFYDADGTEVPWPGSDRLFAVELEALRAIPASIAVAAGEEKVAAIVAGARAGYFNRLATDPATAQLLVTAGRASG